MKQIWKISEEKAQERITAILEDAKKGATKERIITAAEFYDRIVHQAVIQVSENIFERQFVFHTYACRIGSR